MEIVFFSHPWIERERYFTQSSMVFLLTLAMILWGHWIVHANPSLNLPIEEDSRIPLSERVFDSAGQWRAPQPRENKWRESPQEELTLKKERIRKKKSLSPYNHSVPQDNWDPFAPMGHPDTLTRPAKVFEFKF